MKAVTNRLKTHRELNDKSTSRNNYNNQASSQKRKSNIDSISTGSVLNKLTKKAVPRNTQSVLPVLRGGGVVNHPSQIMLPGTHSQLLKQPAEKRGSSVTDGRSIGQQEAADQNSQSNLGGDSSSKRVIRRKTNRLPSIASGSSRHSKKIQPMTYILDVDSRLLAQRQAPTAVGNFYRNLIGSKVLNKDTVPLLKQEQSVLLQLKQNSIVEALKSKNNMTKANTSMDDQGFQTVANMGTVGSNKKFLKRLPTDDSIFHELEKESPSKVDFMQNNSNFLHTGGDSTQFQTSRSRGMKTSYRPTFQESILNQTSQNLDPMAGNSMIKYLNTSVRESARNQINKALFASTRERQRKDRKRKMDIDGIPGGKTVSKLSPQGAPLLGSTLNVNQFKTRQDLNEIRQSFRQTGTLEEVETQQTETDSLANSNCFEILKDEVEVLNAELDYAKSKKQLERKATFSRRSSKMLANLNLEEKVETEKNWRNKGKEELENPDKFFETLQAKIKFKVVKQYQEDLRQIKRDKEKREHEERNAAIKDSYGRVIAIKKSSIKMKREPSKFNRAPKKAPKLKRRRSFTEDQVQFAELLNNLPNPMDKYPKPSLTDKFTINNMQICDRFPIPDQLMSRPKDARFYLQIDSLISAAYNLKDTQVWADYRQSIDAPQNSLCSEDEYPVHDSHSSEEDQKNIRQSDLDKDPNLHAKLFDLKILDTSPFLLELTKVFPYKARMGAIPLHLLKQRDPGYVKIAQDIILEQQKEVTLTKEVIQGIYEYYCKECKAAIVNLEQFYDFGDPTHPKLSIKNYQLDDQTAKALALIIPYLRDFTDIELYNNQLTDTVAAVIVLAYFVNPTMNRFKMGYNFMSSSFVQTFVGMSKMFPNKVIELNLMGCLNSPDYVDDIVTGMSVLKKLVNLNLAGCHMTQQNCKKLATLVVRCETMRTLDVSHCKINYQGTRYVIDALNRNKCMNNFMFSGNDLSSQSNEFSIKIASMITRHPCLMHIDISNTNLKREEILFIGMSLSTSKTMLSCHLTSGGLTYYDRVFLRSVIAARVSFQFRNLTNKKEIKSNKERNQILQMASKEVQETKMRQYVRTLEDLDEKRNGLDFEIQDLLAEIDTEATFENQKPNPTLEDLSKDINVDQSENNVEAVVNKSKFQLLVEKIGERQRQIEEQQRMVKTFYTDETKKSLNDQLDALEGVKEMAMENTAAFGKEQAEVNRPLEKKIDYEQTMQNLRVQRQRARAENQLTKEAKDRSAGELALMFMGINQIAYDLLIENPMTGYMNDIVFTRVLGHEDVEEGTFWTDSTQCWVCSKWSKISISYKYVEDRQIFSQKVNQIENLNLAIDRRVFEHNKSVKMKEMLQAKQKPILDDLEIDEDLELIQPGEKFENDSFIVEAPEDEETGTKMTISNPKTAKFGQTDLKMTGLKTFRNTTQNLGGTIMKSTNQKGSIKNETTETSEAVNPNFAAKSEGGSPSARNTQSKNSTSVIDERDEEEKGLSTADKKKKGVLFSQAETEIEEVEKPFLSRDHDTTNPLGLQKTTSRQIKKFVFPQKITEMQMFEKMDLRGDDIYDGLKSDIFERRDGKNNIKINPLAGPGVPSARNSASILHQSYMHSRDGNSSRHTLQHQHSVISTHEQKRRKRGDPMLIQRTIFFEGMVYQIEEEMYSDSNHSSIYSSEDSFDSDDGLQRRFGKQHPLLSDNQTAGNLDQTETGMSKQAPTNLLQKLGNSLEPSSADKQNSELMLRTSQDDRSANAENNKNNKAELPSTPKLGNVESKSAATPSKPLDKNKGAGGASSTNDVSQGAKTTKKLSKKNIKGQNVGFGNINSLLKQVHYVNDTNLTAEQKDYEPKVAPKHYKPELAKVRMVKFNEIATEHSKSMKRDNKQPKKAVVKFNKQGSMDAKARSTLTDGFKPDEKEIYFVSSFNEWMPMRMKTIRTLNLERFPTDTLQIDIPRSVFMLDNTILLYSSMVPPGNHFFYFVAERGRIFLSPKYDVVRFKNTNIFLNRLIVQRRLEDIETVHFAKAGEEQEAVFMKDRSVFREFKDDTTDYLKKCFDEDMQFSKIKRTCKKAEMEEEFAAIKKVLFKYYEKLKDIHLYYSGRSSYPTISMNDWQIFSHETKLLDEEGANMAQSAMDLVFVATSVSNHEHKKSERRDISRYEFMEIMVRMANQLYKDTGILKTTPEGIEKLLSTYIFPYTKQMDGFTFRKRKCYNVKVNEVLKKNLPLFRKVYDSYTHAKKKYVTMNECQNYIRKVGLSVSEVMVGAIYAESLQTVLDPIRENMIRTNSMKFVEFVVFICRVCHHHYSDTEFHEELLYLKIDHLLPVLLAPLHLIPAFQFGTMFEVEAEKQRERLKRKQKKLKRAVQRAKQEGGQIDKKLIEEVRNLKKETAADDPNPPNPNKSAAGGAGAANPFEKDPAALIGDLSDSSLGDSGDDSDKAPKTHHLASQSGQPSKIPSTPQNADLNELMSHSNIATPINADETVQEHQSQLQESPHFMDNTHEDPEMRQSTVTAIPQLEQTHQQNSIVKQESIMSEIESPNFVVAGQTTHQSNIDDAVSNLVQGNKNL